jgi:hypothetical protein
MRSSDLASLNQDFSKSARDAFSLVDLRVGIESANWAITAWGRNLGDEQYPAGDYPDAGVWRQLYPSVSTAQLRCGFPLQLLIGSYPGQLANRDGAFGRRFLFMVLGTGVSTSECAVRQGFRGVAKKRHP